MRINRSVLHPKYFTCKEWNRFDKVAERENGIDITFQEILLKKYDVILTDYKPSKFLRNKGSYFDLEGRERKDPKPTKKELAVKVGKIIYKNANMKNFNKGMKVFDQGLKSFTDSIDAFTKELGHDNNVKLWSDKKSSVKIWSDKPKNKHTKKKRVRKTRGQKNLEKIFGKK